MNSFKILVWGTGLYANKLLENQVGGNIMGFIETNKSKDVFYNKPVYSPDELPEGGYDFIVVANSYGNQIYQECVKKNIDLEKVIFLKLFNTSVGCRQYEVIKTVLGEKNYFQYCLEHKIVAGTFFEEDKKLYNELNHREAFAIDEARMMPIIVDKYASAGIMGDYFFQDLWAAKRIRESGIRKHYDIGSRIDGFVAHLLAMDIEVTLIDIREMPGEVENLNTIVDDATNLENIPDNSLESISALNSIEHFGLGRYGDPIDPEACFKCFSALQKKLKKGGRLYISFPIGKDACCFNAHRIFHPLTVKDCFEELTLKEFSWTSKGVLELNVDINEYVGKGGCEQTRTGLFVFERG